PLRQDDLLLVAARQRRRGRAAAEVELLHVGRGDRELVLEQDAAQRRQRQVALDQHVQDQALRAALLGNQRQARADRRRRRVERDRLALDLDDQIVGPAPTPPAEQPHQHTRAGGGRPTV